MAKENGFLPINKKEMRERGWKQADFVYVCGDAYVDHPSFGAAIITRLLEDAGYKVAFIAQPDWNDENSIAVCGEPKLAFIVSAGNMDSMVIIILRLKREGIRMHIHREAVFPEDRTDQPLYTAI